MDRKTYSLPDAIKVIEELFNLPEPRRKKCETLFKLARRSTGTIVELGTFRGNGYIALSLGADKDQPVFTVDDYKPKTGWAGENYGPQDRNIFYSRCEKAGVIPRLIEESIENEASLWKIPISLLFWDAGQNNVKSSMKLWEPHIASGGIMALHDTYTNLFRAGEYVQSLVDAGKYCQYEVMPGGVHVAVKV